MQPYLERSIDRLLAEWQVETERKPLLIRGARQVGKTSVVRHLAQHFPHYIEINFEEETLLKQIFESGVSVEEVCEQLSLIKNTPIEAGKTLLFFDEIQACHAAIKALRFFYEKKPDLHVIAAGSLLEFALADLPSFGVGRIRSVFMYPLSFREFLHAMNEVKLSERLSKCDFDHPLPELLHHKLLLLHKKFLIIGGMPEVVRAYTSGKSLLEVQRLLDDLVVSVQADFDKYKSRFPAVRLIEVFNAVAAQIGSKFSYSYPGSSLNYVQIKEALELLQLAGIAYPVTHSSANGIPLGAEANAAKRKFLIYDTGIFQRILGLDIGQLLMEDEYPLVNKGNIAELCVGIELIKSSDPFNRMHLYYWHREARNSQAEVDYVHQIDSKIIPLEVKAGTKGSMQSLFLFLKEKKMTYGVRISAENFGGFDQIKIIPVYAVHLMDHLLKDLS